MPFNLILEALARIEHKLDRLFHGIGMGAGVHPQLHFVGNECPICHAMVDYQIDIQHQVVVRRCGCKTGKIALTIPPPPAEGSKDARTVPAEDPGTGSSEDASARADRPVRPGDVHRPDR